MAKCFAIRWEENFSGNNKLFRVSFGYCWCCCRRVRRLMQCRLNMKCMPSFANSLTFVFFCQIPEFVRCVLVCAFFLSPSSLHHVNFDIKKHIHWHWAQRHAHDIWYGCKISRNYSFRSARQKNEKKTHANICEVHSELHGSLGCRIVWGASLTESPHRWGNFRNERIKCVLDFSECLYWHSCASSIQQFAHSIRIHTLHFEDGFSTSTARCLHNVYQTCSTSTQRLLNLIVEMSMPLPKCSCCREMRSSVAKLDDKFKIIHGKCFCQRSGGFVTGFGEFWI